MKRHFKEDIQTDSKRKHLLKLLKIMLVLEQIISKYQEFLQKGYANNQEKVNKDKIISIDQRSFVRKQNHKNCKKTNDDRISASSNTNSYKNMISQDLNNEKTYKVRNTFIQRMNL